MPKIRIKEMDLTTNALSRANTNCVLFIKEGILQTHENPRLIIKTDLKKENDKDEAFLKEILKLGGKVIVANSWGDAIKYCSDRNQYDVKFLLAKEEESVNVENEEALNTELKCALKIATKRRDCVVIYTKNKPQITEEENTLLSTILPQEDNFLKGEKRAEQGKYVLAFYGDIHSIDDVSNKLDAGKGYLLAYFNNIAQGSAEWLAVAGARRGIIPGYVTDTFLTEDEIDKMQLRTKGDVLKTSFIAINPIIQIKPYGTRIWGNRTCLPNNAIAESTDPDQDQLVAGSFANLRVALADIKKEIYKAGRSCQFEQNTDILWVNFRAKVDPLLEEMKSSYGIAGYRWFRDKEHELRGELRAVLKLVLVEPVEDITVTLELRDSLEEIGVSVTE